MQHYSFVYGSKVGYTGSIFKRVSDNGMGFTFHFGFFYGINKDNIVYLIHNDLHGVECLSLEDWLGEETSFDVELIVNNNTFDQIIARAKERARLPFNVRRNNCEHFVNYAVFGQADSWQATVFTGLSKVLLFMFQINIEMSGSASLKEEFEQLKNKLMRSKGTSLTKVLKEMKQKIKEPSCRQIGQ